MKLSNKHLKRKVGQFLEKPDPQPLVAPTGPTRTDTLRATVERALREAAGRAMLRRVANVEETADEAADFDIDGDPYQELTRFELAADNLRPAEFRQRINEALVQKPSLAGFVRRAFGHLFGQGELPEDAPPSKTPPAAPQAQDSLPLVPPTPEAKKTA